MLNKTFNLSVNNLFEAMFGHTDFCLKFWESRKFYGKFMQNLRTCLPLLFVFHNKDMKIGEWQSIDNYKTRRLDYSVVLNSPIAVKDCKNVEEQVSKLMLKIQC